MTRAKYGFTVTGATCRAVRCDAARRDATRRDTHRGSLVPPVPRARVRVCRAIREFRSSLRGVEYDVLRKRRGTSDAPNIGR